MWKNHNKEANSSKSFCEKTTFQEALQKSHNWIFLTDNGPREHQKKIIERNFISWKATTKKKFPNGLKKVFIDDVMKKIIRREILSWNKDNIRACAITGKKISSPKRKIFFYELSPRVLINHINHEPLSKCFCVKIK